MRTPNRLQHVKIFNNTSVLYGLLLACIAMVLPGIAVPAGNPPGLHDAVRNESIAVLKKRIARHKSSDESLDVQDAKGWTALMYAVRDGKRKAVALLLEAGASATISDRWSRTPIHLAANAPADITRMLIRAGADFDKRNAGGVTPLMMAAGNGRQDIVELLLRAGARLDLKDYDGDSVADWARRSGNVKLADKLDRRLAKIKEQSPKTKSEDFAEDVFADVHFPDWFKQGFLLLDEDLKGAVKEGKQGLMVFISTRRCSYCKAFIDNSLSLPDIRRRVQASFDVVGLEIFDDREMTDPAGKRYIVKEFVTANKSAFTPTLIFYGAGGRKLLKIVGYYPPAKFRMVLGYLEGKHYKRESLRAYARRIKDSSSKQAADIKRDPELFSKPPYILDRRAGPADQPMLVVFEEPDCSACERFHEKVLSDKSVRRLMGEFETVHLDASDTKTRVVTPNGERISPKQWFAKLDLSYRPATVFFDEKGKEVMRLDSETRHYRMEGTLQLILEKAYKQDAQLQRWRRDKAVQFYKLQQQTK
ncbi:MAG: ankyrin repeat domain-containing protein [Gammaproteobacteria bacterium]